jgi:hypothetical protein
MGRLRTDKATRKGLNGLVTSPPYHEIKVQWRFSMKTQCTGFLSKRTDGRERREEERKEVLRHGFPRHPGTQHRAVLGTRPCSKVAMTS